MRRIKLSAILFTTMFLFSAFSIVAVMAGPGKSNSDKVVIVGKLTMIVTKRGWRQWKDEDGDGVYDRFANVLFAEGMKQEAIDAHVNDGWTFNDETVKDGSDARYEHVSHGDLDDNGIVDIIFKPHDIPAGP